MPVIKSCEPRSPPAVESPPRKRFKFSLKLKAKKKAKDKSPVDSDSENESVAENSVSAANFERKPLNLPSTNGLTTGESAQCNFFEHGSETVTPPLPYSGLANLGNTCYLNAVLQVLRYCPGFLKSLQKLDEISGQDCTKFVAGDSGKSNASVSDEDSLPSTRRSIIHSIHKLSNEMESAEKNYAMFGLEANEVKDRSGWTTLAVRPSDFVRDFSELCPLFRGYQQHDAQEFLRSFLGLVEEECVGLVKSEQQDNMKGSNSLASNGDTKVRGGCKYPCTITSSVAVETKGESPKTMCTSDTTRIQPNSEVDWSENGVSENLYGMSPKAVQKSKATCPDVGNVVKRLFEGTLLLQTCCLNCEGIRQRRESFQDISVPVQKTKLDSSDEFGNNLSDSEDESDQDLNLSWAVSKFASVERLNGDNKYFCDNCATLTEADISTYFEKLPQVFTIHLKRFQTSYGKSSLYSSSWVTKVTKSLHTPQQLSLKKWCSKTCSDTDAVYSLFGVVMHNGMSSCSGHYLSYVNVDLLRKQADSGRKMNDNRRPSGVQCEAVASEEEAMEIDVGFEKKVDECFAGGVISKVTGQTGQDRSVKCGSCHSKATVGVTDETVCDLPQGDTSCVTDDEEISCRPGGAVHDGSVPCETKCVEVENRELLCEETLPMDLENSCDCSESVKDPVKQTNSSTLQDSIKDTQKFSTDKSDTQIYRRYPLRSTRTDTMKNGHDSEDSSDDDEIAPDNCGQIPRGMDIKRYFKPIPKSEGATKTTCKISDLPADQACFSETSSASVNTSSNGKALDEGKNQGDSFSQTTDAAFDGQSLKRSLPKSQSSAPSTLETSCASSNMRSDRGSINDESDRNCSCSQTKDASNNMQEPRKSIQEPPSQGSACNGNCSSSKLQNKGSMVQDLEDQERLSCTERQEAERIDALTDHCSESASSLKLMLDMEPSDELSKTKGEFCVNSTDGVTSELHAPAQSTRNCGTGNSDSLAAKCSHSNQNANHVQASLEGSTSHVSSKTNGCTLASRGKSSKCSDTRGSSQIDRVNTSTSGSTWLKFDDAEVQEISGKDMDQILSQSTSCYSTPYLLFYYRC